MGQQFNFSATKIALVAEDTTYARERRGDLAAQRLMFVGRFGRGQYAPLQFQAQPVSVQLSGEPWLEQVHRPASPEAAIFPFRQIAQPLGPTQPFFLRYQSPPASLFFDTFAGLYTQVRAVSLRATTLTTPPQPYFLYTSANRSRASPAFFEDHALDILYRSYPFPYVTAIGIGLYPYTFEVPDLNSDVFAELVHRPLSPEALLFPFRQIVLPPAPATPFNLQWWQSKNWALEAEPIWRVPDTSLLNAFRWPTVIPPTVFLVPTLLGLTEIQADQVLAAAGYLNSVTTYSYSLLTPPTYVMSQNPAGGTNWPLANLVSFVVSIGPFVPGSPPLPPMKVTTRNFSLEEMVARAWGSEFRAPDHRVYVFSNGRGFDSTDIGNTGFYQKGTSTS
jgi:hypothetical protein